MTERTPTTEEDDEGVFNVLRQLIRERYRPGTIGYDYLCGAIDHIRRLRGEINTLRAHGESADAAKEGK